MRELEEETKNKEICPFDWKGGIFRMSVLPKGLQSQHNVYQNTKDILHRTTKKYRHSYDTTEDA